MKYLRYLALAVLTFVFGVSISPIRFYWQSVACGLNGSSIRYRSSLFMQTVDSSTSYDCEKHASDAFQEKLNKATTVFDSSPKVNKQGVLIEQLAVAQFYDQGKDEYYVVCFWRDGKILRTVSSRSYIHVKDFVRQKF